MNLERFMRFRYSLLLGLFCSSLLSTSVDDLRAQQYDPPIAKASGEGKTAIKGFRVPEGMTADLFAAEPMVANPVAFCIDEQGRFFVAETFRQKKGVVDNRNHIEWLEDDLAAQSVEDRLAMFRKHLGDKFESYRTEHDRIRLVVDSDGDGVADKATVFADGFSEAVVGTGAGVLARRGDVFYTCIPDVWRMRDNDGDGRADVRESLHEGYGVRVAFRGHDLHGLTMGPDGRMYFSIGDRGYNVVNKEGQRLKRPDTGAVFRCNPDGTQLEVFCYGLRNPQELAFDDYGNLFTGDNNSDSGDKARWVYLVDGGDTGWRMYYQYLSDRGPWNREKLWHPQFAGQAAYVVPPVAHLGDGPSGLVYYPGVGLPKKYDGHFFMCDFRGTPNKSGVRSFAVEPKGATFSLTDSHEFIWSILGTDVDFDYNGNMYVSDWVNGWNGLGKGRIYRFTHKAAAEAQASGAATLMRDGFAKRSADELVKLLHHVDRRIRLEAQFALVDNKQLDQLAKVARGVEGGSKPIDLFARLHAIWGVGQLARADRAAIDSILPLLDDENAEVRSQVLKVIGDARIPNFESRLANAMLDENARVKYFAAIAAGKCGDQSLVAPLLKILVENNNQDPMLRHAAIFGLSWCAPIDELTALVKHESTAVRLAAVVVLRRHKIDQVSSFLGDADAGVVLEAARAINDEPINGATAKLAELADDLESLGSFDADVKDSLLRRVINANFRLGGPKNVERIAEIAADDSISDAVHKVALTALKTWEQPSNLDGVTGAYRPIVPRSRKLAVASLKPVLPRIIATQAKNRVATLQLAAKYGVTEVVPFLKELIADLEKPSPVRATALTALAELAAEQAVAAIEKSLTDKAPDVRMAARELIARSDAKRAVPLLREAADSGEVFERQHAICLLADSGDAAAADVVANLLTRLNENELPAAIHLDLLEAANKHKSVEVKQQLAAFEKKRNRDDALGEYIECLEGGNSQRGHTVFFGRSDLSCRRCHLVGGSGGNVGPDLSKTGLDKTRRYLLEAIVTPNKAIAKGFESVQIITLRGKVYVGIVKEDTDEQLKLMLADGAFVTIAKKDIDEKLPSKSAMPDDLVKKLTKSDVRDLVEFLTRQKTDADDTQHK
jgi:quinoprotein glucose dehydrogenase